jgi:hypothetical protein
MDGLLRDREMSRLKPEEIRLCIAKQRSQTEKGDQCGRLFPSGEVILPYSIQRVILRNF